MPRADDHPDYRECADADCPRFPCRVYKEGYRDGFDAGFDEGYAQGYATGFEEGMAQRPLRTVYVDVPVGK